MKENIRNIKSSDKLSENSRAIKKKKKNRKKLKKKIHFVHIKWLTLLKKHGEKMVLKQ